MPRLYHKHYKDEGVTLVFLFCVQLTPRLAGAGGKSWWLSGAWAPGRSGTRQGGRGRDSAVVRGAAQRRGRLTREKQLWNRDIAGKTASTHDTLACLNILPRASLNTGKGRSSVPSQPISRSQDPELRAVPCEELRLARSLYWLACEPNPDLCCYYGETCSKFQKLNLKTFGTKSIHISWRLLKVYFTYKIRLKHFIAL